MFERIEAIHNTGGNALEVQVEPWAVSHVLAAGSQIRIVARGLRDGLLEVRWLGNVVTVYAWPGATVQVFDQDKLVLDCSTPVPDLPVGISVRTFVTNLFGTRAKD